MGKLSKRTSRVVALCFGALTLLLYGLAAPNQEPAPVQQQQPVDPDLPELDVDHSNCAFFGAERDKWTNEILSASKRNRWARSALTVEVSSRLSEPEASSIVPGGSRTNTFQQLGQPPGDSTIDQQIFGELERQGVVPADRTNDFEFIRRVTFDLTGRPPAAARVQAFLADVNPDKRSALIDELLQKPEWADKWTMFFGDLYRNTTGNQNVQIQVQGRNAFHKWIRDSLTASKPYDVMARELISAQGTNGWDQGELNWLVLARVGGGPVQDIYDQMAANVAETFLGISHMNCILCHDGRGHLDSLSEWGGSTRRAEAWQLASHLSRINQTLVRPNPSDNNTYYWRVLDTGTADYRLNTTTGNRPARLPLAPGQPNTVAPIYPFSGRRPAPGENYRVALAREITADFQFARATVNYIWAHFFSRGLVEPLNQFDPARLDPSNPPEMPWTLQPSNAALLNTLAQNFISSGYNLRALMRQIVTSDAYQLSSRYSGEWNPAWEPLFARKLVRRLWGEEVHDAVVQSSNIIPTYTIRTFLPADLLTPTTTTLSWAMQLPEPRNLPGGDTTLFLDSFMRGNRDDEERRGDGSVLQALNLMNDRLVNDRIRAVGSGPTGSLLSRALTGSDQQLVHTLYINVLSRYPTAAEEAAAVASLRTGIRTQKAENLLWSLYNKVDFIFNY